MYRATAYAIVALAFLVTAYSPAHARTLKIATVAPEGTTWMQEMRKSAQEIAERTGGRVKLKFYPGGVMGNEKSVLRKIRIGQLHGGAFTGGGLAGVYLDSQIYSLPYIFRSYDEVDYVRTRMDTLIGEGLEQKGLIALGISEGGFAYMMCKRPLLSIDDLKHQKVWAPEGDTMTNTIFEAAGITPVSLPLADVYTGLQTGLIDTVASSPMATIAFQWHTKVKNLTDVPLIYLVGILAVDRKVFNKLTPADRSVVREVTKRVSRHLDRQNRLDNENAKQALMRQGVQFDVPSPGALARWQAIARDALVKLGAKGIYSPAMLKILQDHLEAYRNPGRR